MNQITQKIHQKIREKKSNLCISLDYTECQKILDVVELVKDSIIMIKLHIDIIEDFTPSFMEELVKLTEENGILILEDRKFADIGHIFQKQFTGGLYKIQSWCHLITLHALVGPGPLQAFEKCSNLEKQGILLIGQMSNSGNWLDTQYHSQTLWLARLYPKLVSGFISQNRNFERDESFLQFTPGVNRNIVEDKLDQRYKTPSQAIEDGADVIIVGRGITGSYDVKKEAEIYRKMAWEKYVEIGHNI